MLGAPFYLMERRRGVILRKELPPRPRAPTRAASCELLVDALVDLHAVDYTAAGLGDFGKPAGYVERQVKGWTERYAGSQTDDVPAMTEAGAWLAAHKPADVAPALIHNDFKFDNVIFDPGARADHRRARLGDGDDRRSADGSRHVALVLGAGRRSPRCSSSRCSASRRSPA